MPKPSETREASEKIPKPGGKLDKYKWYIVGGLAILAILVFYFVQKSKQNASATGGTSSLAAMGIDPATGVPYAQEYANSMGGSGFGGYPFMGTGGRGRRGPAGPPGKTGPTGKTGPRGRRPPPKKHHHKHKNSPISNQLMQGAVNTQARAAHNRRIVPAANKHTVRS